MGQISVKTYAANGSLLNDNQQIAFVIGNFAPGQGKSYGQAHRVDAQMDLGRKATF
jgi:hypothetical protein